jgi:hypothetical protein
MGPYTDTTVALERAIATTSDELTRYRLEAEMAEVRFLHGEDEAAQGNAAEGVA